MNRESLLTRSIIAIILLIGFYVLALGMAAGLLWTVYAQLFIAHRVLLKLAFICVVLAGIIVWSVLPRPDHFEPPGPELTESAHPRLFALIRDVADKTRQAMPREVYLIADVNAFVAQRGGMMGFFSRRVMGLGLPLLALLSVSELRAVLAHEFGHFHGGDTMLGPWIYKTRSAMVRTIVALAERGSSIVRKPFEWYGNFFLSITHSISRAQELSADALAARVAGGRHLVSGLKATHAGAAAFQAFVQQEYAPVLRAGFRPPMAQGFRTFLDEKQVKAKLEKLVRQEIEGSESNPFDTHPPLAARIEAIGALQDAVADADPRPSLELLDHPDKLEATLVKNASGGKLKRLAWANVTDRVLLPEWSETADKVAGVLGTVTLAELVRPPAKLWKVAARVLGQDLGDSPDIAARIGANMLAAAVCSTLADAGWTVKNRLGRPIVLRKGELRLSPFKHFAALAEGKLSVDALVARLTEAGVHDLPLAGANKGETSRARRSVPASK